MSLAIRDERALGTLRALAPSFGRLAALTTALLCDLDNQERPLWLSRFGAKEQFKWRPVAQA